MQILAHRGWWLEPSEKNTATAFSRALSSGYGLEIDVRDCDGRVVVSHDMPRVGHSLSFEQFLEIYGANGGRQQVAINIKSDGIAQEVSRLISSSGLDEYFVFDMSIPDTVAYLQMGLRVFTRRSEFETGSLLDGRAAGLWLDAFSEPYVPSDRISAAVEGKKPFALVSPELHQRGHVGAWAVWRDIISALSEEQRQMIMICTDLPSEAASFFVNIDDRATTNDQSRCF